VVFPFLLTKSKEMITKFCLATAMGCFLAAVIVSCYDQDYATSIQAAALASIAFIAFMTSASIDD
jgi:hypothetical protein